MIAYATLTPDSPRRAEWMELFGADRVCLESSESHMVILPGLDGPRRCYRANVESLAYYQKDNVVRSVASRFFDCDWMAAGNLLGDAHGLPILDGPDLLVTIEAKFYL